MKNNSTIFGYVTYGHIEKVRQMLMGVNCVSKNGDTPLVLACRHGHANIVRELLNAGADVNRCDKSPLDEAIKNNHPGVVLVLIDHQCY